MDLELIPILIDIAVGLGTLLVGALSYWAILHKRISAWWKPYRTGIDAMAHIPALRESIEANRKETENVRSTVGMLALSMRARGDINIENAEFEANVDGDYTYVNKTFARWLGVGTTELLGKRYLGFIHPEDRARARQEWEYSRADHRVYNQRYRVVTVEGEEIVLDVLITPIPEAPPAKSWIGVARRVVS